MLPREQPALEDLPVTSVVRIGENDDVLGAVKQTCGSEPSLLLEAEPGLCSELTERPGRRFVHLINYRADEAIENITVRLRLPDTHRVKAVTLASPEREQDLQLGFEEQAGVVIFGVPRVGVYEIAVVTMK
jgi:hypothetical protein